MGDRVALFSDGVTEATDDSGQLYGLDWLAYSLASAAELGDSLHELVADVRGHAANLHDG